MEDRAKTALEATVAVDEIASGEREAGSSLVHSPRLGDRYAIEALLGVGGMGAVYRARDTRLDEHVALKMLRAEFLTTPAMRARFVDEVKIARKVTHRNVARTFDIGEHEGRLFLTMELLDGGSLSDRLERDGPLPPADAIRIAIDVAAGLGAAHAASVVHCDLKPDNVILTNDGRAVVTDFGIARAASGQSRGFAGTPAYVAPEQIGGEGDLDGRADLYALGELLYESLTGARPWRGVNSAATMSVRLTSPPPDPRALRAEIAAPLAAVVRKLMATERGDRYATADETIAALRALDASARAPRASSPPPPVPPPTLRSERTVAVLPFEATGAEHYVAAGIHEDIVDTLAMTRGVRVKPAGVVAAFGGSDARTAGRELGVQVVVEGSIRASDDGLRLALRAIAVDDGFQIWTGRWARPTSEGLRLADDAAKAVAAALTGELDLPLRGEAQSGASDVYLRARAAFRDAYFALARAPEAAALFDEAVAGAPEDARVLAGAAVAHARVAWTTTDRADAARERAQELADRAIALAPQLAEPWLAIATLRYDGCEPVAVVGALRSALRAAPHSARAREILGRTLVEAGALDEAIALLQAALELDASNDSPRWDLARAFAYRGDFARARELLALTLASEASRSMRAWVRGRLALWQPDPEAVRVALADTLPMDGPVAHAAARTHAALKTKTLEGEPLRSLERAFEDPARRIRLIARQAYVEHRAFGGTSGADLVSVVRTLVDDGLTDLAWLDGCPLLAPVRAAAGWDALRQRVERQASRVVEAYRR